MKNQSEAAEHEITGRIRICYPQENWAVQVKTVLDNHSTKYDWHIVYVESVVWRCMSKNHN